MSPDPAADGGASASHIDTEHQLQVGLVSALCDAVRTGAETAQTQQILERLAEYSEAHFTSEQLLMRLASYPEYEDHVVDHDHMTEMLRGIAAAVAEGGGALTADEAQDMLYFLSRHIATRDRRFAEYYAEWQRRAKDAGASAPPGAGQ